MRLEVMIADQGEECRRNHGENGRLVCTQERQDFVAVKRARDNHLGSAGERAERAVEGSDVGER